MEEDIRNDDVTAQVITMAFLFSVRNSPKASVHSSFKHSVPHFLMNFRIKFKFLMALVCIQSLFFYLFVCKPSVWWAFRFPANNLFSLERLWSGESRMGLSKQGKQGNETPLLQEGRENEEKKHSFESCSKLVNFGAKLRRRYRFFFTPPKLITRDESHFFPLFIQ